MYYYIIVHINTIYNNYIFVNEINKKIIKYIINILSIIYLILFPFIEFILLIFYFNESDINLNILYITSFIFNILGVKTIFIINNQKIINIIYIFNLLLIIIKFIILLLINNINNLL